MELEVHLTGGETFRVYDARAETPDQALALLRDATRQRPDWVQLGTVVLWTGQIAYVESVDPANAQEDPE